MNIGIDAKWFFNGPPSGRVVVQNLVKELASNNFKRHKFFFFIPNKDENLEFPYHAENLKVVYVSQINNLFSNLFVLPMHAKRLNLDVILFQNFGPFSKSFQSIVYIHDLLYLDFPQYYGFKEKMYLKFLKPLAKRADKIVTISETEKERIVRHQLGLSSNIHVVYHGVNNKFKVLADFSDTEIVAVSEKYDLPDRFVLYLGRLNIRKNIKNLLLAMKLVDIPLVIVGEHDHKTDDFKTIIKQQNLENKIIFTGYVDASEIPLLYSLSMVFCFPSFAEGFGLPPLEAMASGTPVVVSDRTSLPEVCGDAALYVDADDPNDIAKKLNLLIESSSKRKEYSLKGIQRAEKFKWSIAAEKLIAIMESDYDR
ncbi:MAG: glycosyltransferase family 4 protein [Aquaticitalea sp.]